jgi:cytosine permease
MGAFGIGGAYPIYYASFAAMILGPFLHVGLTLATRGRYYRVASEGRDEVAATS